MAFWLIAILPVPYEFSIICSMPLCIDVDRYSLIYELCYMSRTNRTFSVLWLLKLQIKMTWVRLIVSHVSYRTSRSPICRDDFSNAAFSCKNQTTAQLDVLQLRAVWTIGYRNERVCVCVCFLFDASQRQSYDDRWRMPHIVNVRRPPNQQRFRW